MSNRTAWKFSYNADQLTTAAKTKFDYHSARLVWWQQKQQETIAKIKSEGVKVDESIVEELTKTGYSTSNIGRGPQVQIRNDLLADLNECAHKVEEHRRKIKDYEGWVEILASQGQLTLALDQEDWLFFFSKK